MWMPPQVRRHNLAPGGERVKRAAVLQRLLYPAGQDAVPLCDQGGDLASGSCSGSAPGAVDVVDGIQGEVKVDYMVHPPRNIESPVAPTASISLLVLASPLTSHTSGLRWDTYRAAKSVQTRRGRLAGAGLCSSSGANCSMASRLLSSGMSPW